MINSPRILVHAVSRYCAERGIALDVRADGWLLLLDHAGRRRLIFGYDLGLNSAVAHRLASDKAATAEVLSLAGVACVPHVLFMRPPFDAPGAAAAMLELLEAHPGGLVVKPNEGTSGRYVERVSDQRGLQRAVETIFARGADVAISPLLGVEAEVRVILLDGDPLIVYAKERRPPEWRHNLELGARPVLLDTGTAREACVTLARSAAATIGIRFASVDVVLAAGRWQVLEINSGVVMEVLGRMHSERVDAAYAQALDLVFAGADL